MRTNEAKLDGLEATRRIVARHPAIRVLVLSMHAPQELLIPVLEAGASGYATKDCADVQLVEAIRTVANGQVYLPPAAARLLLENLRAPRTSPAGAEPLQLLSRREREVLAGTAAGFTAAEIGSQLGISPKTVDTYRQRLMEKLGLRHRSEVVQFALTNGLLAASAA